MKSTGSVILAGTRVDILLLHGIASASLRPAVVEYHARAYLGHLDDWALVAIAN